MKKRGKTVLLLLIGILTISNTAIAQNDFAKTAISIGVVVEDLDKSLDFYQNVVGMVNA